jgi:hypothetical protein
MYTMALDETDATHKYFGQLFFELFLQAQRNDITDYDLLRINLQQKIQETHPQNDPELTGDIAHEMIASFLDKLRELQDDLTVEFTALQDRPAR